MEKREGRKHWVVEALVNRKKEEADAHEEGDRNKNTIEKDIGQAQATIKSHSNVFTSSMERALTKKLHCRLLKRVLLRVN